jgi:argininosuccinate synthase
MPNVKIIAPWREWDLLSREKLMAYAETHGIPVDMKHKKGGSPYSMDANLLHISYEGRIWRIPAAEAEESMWRWTVSPEGAEQGRVPRYRVQAGDPSPSTARN